MNNLCNKLVSLGKSQFENELLTKIKEAVLSDKIIASISGSTSFGFADESSDIDFDVLITEKISADQDEVLKNILSKDYFIDGKRVSYGYDLKKSLARYLRGERQNYWDDFNPYDLFSVKHYIPVLDVNNRMAKLQDELSFYPKEIFTSVIRGLWISASNSGEYNSLQTYKRGSESEANIFLYRGYEALLRMVFVLNNKYYPPTKWLSAGLKGIENKFNIDEFTNAEKQDFPKKYDLLMKTYKMICEYMVENNILDKESVENYGSNFGKEYFIFETF